MIYCLTYKKGSFLQSEEYSSLLAALGRAAIILEAKDCSDLAIQEDGVHHLHHADIVLRLAGTNVPRIARPPFFRL